MNRLFALLTCAVLMLPAAFLIPVPSVAAKTATCDEGMAPSWISFAYARVPVGLADGTHEFRIDFEFTDVDGSHVVDYFSGSFDVSSDVPVVPGTVWVTPWDLSLPQPPHDRYQIWAMNPAQPAVFVLGWVNYQADPGTGTPLTRRMFTATIRGAVQTVSLDGGPALPMHFHQTASECMWLP